MCKWGLMEIGFIICSRVKSSRVPEKVLQYIDHRRAIEILLERCINDRYSVVLAIPDTPEDDILEEVAAHKGIEVYRGHNDSPLHRMYAVAKKYNFDYVVRITHDDILIDLTLLFNMINFCLNGNQEYVYMKRCPEGIASEIIKTSAVEKAVKEVGNKPVEFISYHVRGRCKTIEYYPPFEYQYSYRLTLDYEEDLMLLRVLFASMKNPGTLDIINFLKKHPYFLKINHLPKITAYTCNYNTADYIKDCIDSVVGQTYHDYEYIILDDCSTDESMNVITEHISKLSLGLQNKIKVLRNEKNIGLSASSNKCLSLARGEFVVRIDSDDTLHNQFFTRTIEQSQLDGSNGVICGYNETGPALSVTAEVLENRWHPASALLSLWCTNEIKYKEDIEFAEGNGFYKRWRELFKTSFIKEPLWNYRTRPGQKTQDERHPDNEQV